MCLRSNKSRNVRSGMSLPVQSSPTYPTANPTAKGSPASPQKAKRKRKAERKHQRYVKLLNKTKKRARSELKNAWSKHGYGERFTGTGWLKSSGNDKLPVLDGAVLSFAEFSHHIEKNNQPCLIKNLLQHWPAKNAWTSSSAIKSIVPKDYGCKVGSDDDGYAVRLRYKHFHRYAHDPDHGLKDDSPLYIFDSNMLEKTGMARDYIVPHLFSEDLLKYAGEDRRPPYRWICIGGARSGTGIHVDPLGTSAWNALVAGHKRWALFPPGSVPKSVLKPKGVNSAVRWFDIVWPETQRAAWEARGYPKPIDVWQGPGETVFVPSGWWHVVVNLDFTVAVTHNFCSTHNFGLVFRHTRVSRPKMSLRWLDGLKVARPDLYEAGLGIKNRGEVCSEASSPTSSSTDVSSSSSSSDDDSN